MADQEDLPSDSDASDVDFKPSDEESLPSEEESDGSVEEAPIGDEEESNIKTGKRKKLQIKKSCRKKRKQKKEEDNEDDGDRLQETEECKKLTAEEEKKRADALWNEFMNDSSPSVGKASDQTQEENSLPSKSPVEEKENKTVITEVYEFAGEKITVQKEAPTQHFGRGRGSPLPVRGRGRGRGVGGIAAIIGQLGKKNKLSTLEKSKLDWNNFKKYEGIEEDLERHNKGKEGYLERQDFLQRTDLRQFEIEKQLRTTSRSNR